MPEKKTVIIESSNTYFGGGYTLLKQLVDKLELRQQYTIVFLEYPEIYKTFQGTKYLHVKFIITNRLSTLLRYFKKRERVLFFCNLPPIRKQEKSVLYFHNPNILRTSFSISNNLSLFLKVKYMMYKLWLKSFYKNVNHVACQTLSVRDQLKKLGAKAILLPFYNEVIPLIEDKRFDFCYVSSFAPHKNHNNLIKAIKILRKEKHFNIAITIDDSEKTQVLIGQIKELNHNYGGQCICNMGRISREQVIKLYSQSRALVFPSFTETFGLPVVEAVQCNLPVLISDRPYAYDLLENPIVFDPENPESIAEQMRLFLDGNYNNTIQRLKTDNKINELIELLIA